MAEYLGPIPVPDANSEDFWDGCKRHELTFKRCKDCSFYIHLPKERCPKCWSTNIVNVVVSGKGTVYTATFPWVPTAPGFEPPYNVVLVDLDEQPGLRIMSNVVDCPIDDVVVGMRVEVTFQDIELDGGKTKVSLPKFRPIKN